MDSEPEKRPSKLAVAVVIVMVFSAFILWVYYAQINDQEFFEHCKHELESHTRSLESQDMSDKEIALGLNEFAEKIGCPIIQG